MSDCLGRDLALIQSKSLTTVGPVDLSEGSEISKTDRIFGMNSL